MSVCPNALDSPVQLLNLSLLEITTILVLALFPSSALPSNASPGICSNSSQKAIPVSLKINRQAATELVRAEAKGGTLDPAWVDKFEHFSQLCEAGVSKTHIAFLGTAILAKAMNASADLCAIKPDHAEGNANSFSARTLCHGVLVPIAAEIGISLGVSGREPLNNQPYFRMTRLDDGTPVHPGGRAAFDYMLALINELQALPHEIAARRVLRAFIAVRRRYLRTYADFEGGGQVTPSQLKESIKRFVGDNAEGGRRAQAVVAGLMDVFAGTIRVESGRINDPSRKYPGDVCIRSASDSTLWEKAFEVRDKPVSVSDAQIFGKKCAEMGLREAAIVMASNNQPVLDIEQLNQWASRLGIGMTMFYGWDEFVEQALFWAAVPKAIAATHAAEFIYERLVTVEVSPAAVDFWKSLNALNK